jgi:hypothetical protein
MKAWRGSPVTVRYVLWNCPSRTANPWTNAPSTTPCAKVAMAEAIQRCIRFIDSADSLMSMQGFSRMFKPVNYAPSETDHERVKARGKEIMERVWSS